MLNNRKLPNQTYFSFKLWILLRILCALRTTYICERNDRKLLKFCVIFHSNILQCVFFSISLFHRSNWRRFCTAYEKASAIQFGMRHQTSNIKWTYRKCSTSRFACLVRRSSLPEMRPDTNKTWNRKEVFDVFPQFSRSNSSSRFLWVLLYFYLYRLGCVMCKNHYQSQYVLCGYVC